MVAVCGTMPLAAQQAAAVHQSGTVKTATASDFVLTTATGQDVSVTVPATAKVMIVAPGSKDLSSAQAGSGADVQPGDRALVTGTAGDGQNTLTAMRVILMKSAAIAQTHEQEEAAWAHGGGGIVKSVDPAAGTIVISSGLRTVTVKVQPSTIFRRYAGDSVRFEDAVKSDLSAVRRGDQLRVRGAVRGAGSADGSTIVADEIVTGSFHNYSGLLLKVDATAGTVTLKDLATKKTVTVAVTPNSDVRALPAMAARMIAGRMRGGAAGATAGARSGTGASAGSSAAEGAGAGEQGATGSRRAGMDLSQMLARLPKETVAELKPGDAVMIVAAGGPEQSAAVTLLTGVEPILSAPAGQTTVLSPWSVGTQPDAAMGGEGGQGPGR
jgi:hypothetical protein